MGTDPIIAAQSDTRRYEAIVRISEAIAACREPEQLATTLADEIGKFLNFDHLYLTVLKENSKEIEYLLWGKSPIPSPDLPMEELPTWSAINSRDPQHTPDWNTEERFPPITPRETGRSCRSGCPSVSSRLCRMRHFRIAVCGPTRREMKEERDSYTRRFLRLISPCGSAGARPE